MATITLNGADLSYEEKGQGEPVLFLHGLGSSSAHWAPQMEHFSRSYRCIAVDARGSGHSRDRLNPGGPFSIAGFAADAAALLSALGASPAHVVGLSMGGMIGFQLAVDHPHAVRTLTVVNSGPSVRPKTLRDRLKLLFREIVTRLLGPAGVARMIAPKLFPKPEQEALRQAFRAAVARNDPKAYLATSLAIMGWSVEEHLGTIDVPTLVVAADGDYTPVSTKQAYARAMPRAEVVVVEDARHALPVEAPEKFNAVLAPFLAQHALPRARRPTPSMRPSPSRAPS